MDITYTHPRSLVTRLLAVTVGAVGVGLFVGLFVVPAGASASPRAYGASQLSAVSEAVQRSGVAGRHLVHQRQPHHTHRPDRRLQLPGQRLRVGPLRQHL